MNVTINLILYKTLIQKQFQLFVFVFINSSVVSASQDAGGLAISRQINTSCIEGCHTCWLSCFTLICLWCGRTDGRAFGHVIAKISQMGRLPHFLRHGAMLVWASRVRGAPLINSQHPTSCGKISTLHMRTAISHITWAFPLWEQEGNWALTNSRQDLWDCYYYFILFFILLASPT